MKTFKQHPDFISISTPVNSEDFNLFQSIVNIGIDSHLEGFTKSMFFLDCGRFYFHFHKTETPILFRRLMAIGSFEANTWMEDIKEAYKIN